MEAVRSRRNYMFHWNTLVTPEEVTPVCPFWKWIDVVVEGHHFCHILIATNRGIKRVNLL